MCRNKREGEQHARKMTTWERAFEVTSVNSFNAYGLSSDDGDGVRSMIHGCGGDDSQSGRGGEGCGMQMDAGRVEPFGVCTISANSAVLIYLAKKKGQASSRGHRLAARLAERFGITPKAIRDIWTLRSWATTTRPHWTPEDHVTFIKKKLCESCRHTGLSSFEHACAYCKARKPRGHPFPANPPASPALSRKSSGFTKPTAAQDFADVQERLSRDSSTRVRSSSPSAPGRLGFGSSPSIYPFSRSPCTRPTNHAINTNNATWYPDGDVSVEKASSTPSKPFDEGCQVQNAGKDGGLEWHVPPEEIARQFHDLLVSWEATLCILVADD